MAGRGQPEAVVASAQRAEALFGGREEGFEPSEPKRVTGLQPAATLQRRRTLMTASPRCCAPPVRPVKEQGRWESNPPHGRLERPSPIPWYMRPYPGPLWADAVEVAVAVPREVPREGVEPSLTRV